MDVPHSLHSPSDAPDGVPEQELSFLARIESLARGITGTTDPGRFLREVCEAVAAHCGAEHAGLACLPPHSDEALLVVSTCAEGEAPPHEAMEALLEIVLASGTTVIAGEARIGALLEGWTSPARERVRSVGAVPIRIGTRVAGVLAGFCPGPSTRGALSRMEHLAIFAGSALNTVWLVEELQHKNRELEEAVGHLQVAQRARDEFFRFLIHDLNKPLAAIIGTATRLADHDEMPPSLVDRAERVSTAATRLRDIVARLLEYERIRRGEITLQLGPVNMWRQTVEIARLLSEKFPHVTVELAGEPLERVGKLEKVVALADELQISRVIQNLVDNALKFARGRVTVDIAASGEEVVFRIWNDGPPIDPEDRERIFAEFFRRDQGAGEARGYGIGLASARHLVETFGGRIWIDPTTEGACFKVALPRAE